MNTHHFSHLTNTFRSSYRLTGHRITNFLTIYGTKLCRGMKHTEPTKRTSRTEGTFSCLKSQFKHSEMRTVAFWLVENTSYQRAWISVSSVMCRIPLRFVGTCSDKTTLYWTTQQLNSVCRSQLTFGPSITLFWPVHVCITDRLVWLSASLC